MNEKNEKNKDKKPCNRSSCVGCDNRIYTMSEIANKAYCRAHERKFVTDNPK
jgi:hypothetical protein